MAGLRHWTHDLCIEALLDWAAQHDGVPPRAIDWRRAAPDHPGQQTIAARFGSWNAGLKAAGLPTRIAGNPGSTWWTRARVVYAIRAWAVAHQRVPRTRDWYHATPHHPNASTVARACGSWNFAIAAAGFSPRKARGTSRRLKSAGLRAAESSSENSAPPSKGSRFALPASAAHSPSEPAKAVA